MNNDMKFNIPNNILIASTNEIFINNIESFISVKYHLIIIYRIKILMLLVKEMLLIVFLLLFLVKIKLMFI